MCDLSFQELPPTQLPEVFGMHDNVDITRELHETQQLFDSVLLTLGQGDGGMSGQTDETLFEIATDILAKVCLFTFYFYLTISSLQNILIIIQEITSISFFTIGIFIIIFQSNFLNMQRLYALCQNLLYNLVFTIKL